MNNISMFILKSGGCGDIPAEITDTIGAIYNMLLIIIPVLIVLFGVIDFLKASIAQKDDGIKQSTGLFVKRLIMGVLAFLILGLVKFGVSLMKTNNTSGVSECLNSIFGNGK